MLPEKVEQVRAPTAGSRQVAKGSRILHTIPEMYQYIKVIFGNYIGRIHCTPLPADSSPLASLTTSFQPAVVTARGSKAEENVSLDYCKPHSGTDSFGFGLQL